MSKIHETFKAPEADKPIWYLKISDDMVYGPITMNNLRKWSEEGRVAAGNMVSHDNVNWIEAESFGELKMEWVVKLKNGERYGPFNILAAPVLISRGILESKAILNNILTHKEVALEDIMKGFGSSSGKKTQPKPEAKKEKEALTPTTEKKTSIQSSDKKAARAPSPALGSPEREAELTKLISRLSQDLQSKSHEVTALEVDLEKQGQEYQLLKEQSHEKEIDLFRKIQQLQKDASSKDVEEGSLSTQLEKAKQMFIKLQDDSRMKAKELANEITGLNRTIVDKERLLEKLQAQVNDNDNKNKKLEQEFTEQKQQIENKLKDLEKKSGNSAEELKEAKQALEKEKKINVEHTEKGSAANKRLKTEIQQLQASLSESNKKLEDAATKLATHEKQSNSSIANSARQIKELQTEITVLKDKTAKAANDLVDAKKDLEQQAANNVNLESQAKDRETKLAEHIEKSNSEALSLNAQITKLKQELELIVRKF